MGGLGWACATVPTWPTPRGSGTSAPPLTSRRGVGADAARSGSGGWRVLQRRTRCWGWPRPRPTARGAPRPHLTCALVIADQPAQPLAHVHPSAGGPTRAPADGNGRGIHHRMRHPVRLSKPRQPDACVTRCVAPAPGGGLRQAHAAWGLGDCVKHALRLPCGHGARARLLTRPGGEVKIPGGVTQCNRHKHGPLACGILRRAGRCGGPRLAPP